MKARRLLIALLSVGMLANGALLIDALTVGLLVPVTIAETAPEGAEAADADTVAEEVGPPHPAEQGPEVARATYRRLIDQLTHLKQRLDGRAEDLSERERQLTVAQEELRAERDELEALRQKIKEERKLAAGMSAPSFDRLLKAYEGMEPENAAAALVQLYSRDRQVVIDLLLGLKSRQGALVLDAVAAANPKVAAELSLEIWQNDPSASDS